MRGIIDFIVRRPRTVVIVSALVLLAALVPAGALNDRLADSGYDVPGSQSQVVNELSAGKFGGADRQQLYAVLRGGTRPALEARAQKVREALRRAPELASAQVLAVQRRGEVALVPFTVRGTQPAVEKQIPRLREVVRSAGGGADLLGQTAVWHEVTRIAQEDLSRAETLALPVTLIVLVIAFLSLVAAGLPILLALVSLVVTFGALSLLGLVLDMSVYVTNTASILGLGLAIDYSLFMVTRYRELRGRGDDVEAGVQRALQTTGRAILFSGLTVALALSSLSVMGVGVFGSMAIGASLAAAVAALGALTLVPAVLVLLGTRIDRLRVKPLWRASGSAKLWRGLARVVLARPKLTVGATVLLLVVCAIPLTSLKLMFASNDIMLPKGDSLRAVNDAVGRDFGPGALSPIVVVAEGDPSHVVVQLRRTPGIAAVSAPQAGEGGWFRVIATPTTPRNTPAAERVVRDVRSRLAGAGARVYVGGGETAQGMDLIHRIVSRFPLMVLVASVLSFTLLLVTFRSLVVPLKAVLTNLLSVAATLGLVTLLFQILGDSAGIAWFVPPFLLAIVFGLSMDYEILLLSRVREEHLAGASNREAITRALVRNARPITLAALVMLTVFLAFAVGRVETFRQLGIGMAIAVLLDATVMRCALVPAALLLLGDRNWWLPRTLGRLGQEPKLATERTLP